MSIPSRMPASSRACSDDLVKTRADHGILWVPRRACSNTAPHRLELLDAARRGRKARSRRPSPRTDVLSQRSVTRWPPGAIKSGGTTRRAAKMSWSMSITRISRPISTGRCARREGRRPRRPAKSCATAISSVMKACVNWPTAGDAVLLTRAQPGPQARESSAPARRSPKLYQARESSSAKQGYKDESNSTSHDTDWDREAYLTVSGQNSNNSVSLKAPTFLRGPVAGTMATGT